MKIEKNLGIIRKKKENMIDRKREREEDTNREKGKGKRYTLKEREREPATALIEEDKGEP